MNKELKDIKFEQLIRMVDFKTCFIDVKTGNVLAYVKDGEIIYINKEVK